MTGLFVILNGFRRLFYRIVIGVLRLFVHADKKTILFNSFYGSSYNDSTRVIYEKMTRDQRFKGYRMYWLIDDFSKMPEVDPRFLVRDNSVAHVYYLLKAKYWVSNSTIELVRQVSVPRAGHVYINTWHGIPLKYLGGDELEQNFATKWFSQVQFDYLCACNDYDGQIFAHIFPRSAQQIHQVGLPRNESLQQKFTQQQVTALKQKLGVPLDKKVVLYGPTFRDFEVKHYQYKNASLDPTGLDTATLTRIKQRYVILNRSHYYVADNRLSKQPAQDSTFVYDVTDYPQINDLFQIADILVTDYSSLMFDFAILGKPILLLQADLQVYIKRRGLYMNPAGNLLPSFTSTSKLYAYLAELGTADYSTLSKQAKAFAAKYQPKQITATTEIIDYIESH